MRFASVRSGEARHAVRLEGDTAAILPFNDVGELLGALGGGAEGVEGGAEVPALGLEFAPVVPDPPRIFCVGLNYRTHILEMKRELPAFPTLFAKFAAALVGPRDRVCLPAASEKVDWEAELAVVVGRGGRHLSEEEALDAIAGYSVINDVTARDFQNRTLQWLQGKTFEGTCPFGPVLVTPDEVDHARDLEITCEVDGEVVQRARTSDLLFTPAHLVSYLSQIVTLLPGDVIATGTPGGVGAGMDPPRFLKDGSVVRTAIEGIGELVNVCVAERR
ncbi:MAG TPA: fumarylacetoacetate hydrolase family protein [Acidimicrobiales bacterium]|nr:fumarylacetoacetate hydrolase family protein [Acidimicrobiales bacterium]